jgi:nucleoside recognition membrane protein YjiH
VIQSGGIVNEKPMMHQLKNAEVLTIVSEYWSQILVLSNLPSLFCHQNMFSNCLCATGFNIFSALVMNFLHDCKIDVWKLLFIHLIRVLEVSSSGSMLVNKLDK